MAFAAWLLKIVAAASLGESMDPRLLQRAVALEPDNAQLHFNLGTVYLWGDSCDPALAARELRIATELNGNAAEYWSALGKACYAVGDQFCTDHAFRRAADLAPAKSRYAWEAGLHYAVTNRPDEAAKYLRRSVALKPERAQDAFEVLLRVSGSSELAWNEVARKSGNLGVQLTFLALLARRGDFDGAARYWAQIAVAQAKLPLAAVQPYLERVLDAGEYEEARSIWAYLEQTGTVPAAHSDSPNLIVNSGFEHEPTNVGFDWHVMERTFVATDFRDRSGHSGGRALRVDFTVPDNYTYEPVFQLVPVSPKRSYVLTAYARSNQITSDSGPRLRVADVDCPACLETSTQAVTGTTDWHRVSAAFTTLPTTKAVRISLWRPRSRVFPMEISGEFWLDDVSLQLASADDSTGN